MKYLGTLIAVRDMEASKRFYTGLLGMKVEMDLGANVSLSGVALQTLETWAEFTGKKESDIRFGGAEFELDYEVEDLDAFLETLKSWPEVEWVHPVREFPWGQRVVRLYDPDRHIVEVGEDMRVVVKRYLKSGLTVEETVQRSMFPVPFVEMCKAELEGEG